MSGNWWSIAQVWHICWCKYGRSSGRYSKKEFRNKVGISHKEARESNYWLRLLRDSGQVKEELIEDLIKESEEITKVLFSIGKASK